MFVQAIFVLKSVLVCNISFEVIIILNTITFTVKVALEEFNGRAYVCITVEAYASSNPLP